MILKKHSNVRVGSIVWNSRYPEDKYTVESMCDKSTHKQPCYVVTGIGVFSAHLGPSYYREGGWEYKNWCMFEKDNGT